MKKFFKSLMICLVILPCVLVLAACGGNPNQVKVNTKGNYKASNLDAFNTTVTQAQTDETLEFGAYRVSSVTTGKEKGEKVSIELHATLLPTEGGDYQMFYIANMAGIEVEMYADANYLYTKMDDFNGKTARTAGDITEVVTNLTKIVSIEGNYLAQLALLDTSKIDVKAATQGTTTKYHLHFNLETTGDTNIWFVFENGVLTGLKMTSEIENAKTEVQVERFTGTAVEAPSWTEKAIEVTA